MIATIEYLGAFILVLGILIFVHELGHFLAAKRYGIGVPVFSLGFGPRLFGFKRGGTDYRVALIPLGGYVRMAGDEADENRSGGPDEFLSRSRWQRFVVFVAGATFNIVLAVLVVTLLFRVWGKEEAPAATVPPTVVEVMEGSTAAAAGVQPGDQVIAIADRDMREPRTEAEEVLLQPDTEKTVLLEREGQRVTVSMNTGSDPRYHLGFPGWLLRSDSPGTPGISFVAAGSPAERAGLKRGDKIEGIDEVMDPGEVRLRAMVAASPGQEIVLHVDRGGERLDVKLVPRDESGVGRIGVVFRTEGPVRTMGLGEAFVESLRFNGETARALFLALRSIGSRLFRGEIGAVRAFSGPIEIAEMSRRSLEDVQAFLQFLAILSLNLGIFNLLPIPVLDGGHILILGVEGALRKDLSQKIKERVLQAGFVFLILLFSAVMFFDVVKRYFPS